MPLRIDHLSLLDVGLLIVLLFILPMRQIRRSLGPRRPPADRLRSYWTTTSEIGVLLAVLTLSWIMQQRPLGALGLDMPVSAGGQVGLAIAAIMLAGFYVLTSRMPIKADAAPDADAMALFPETGAERRAFVVMSLAIGIGWEVLYRGFLL